MEGNATTPAAAAPAEARSDLFLRTPVASPNSTAVKLKNKVGEASFCAMPQLWRPVWVKATLERVLRVRFVVIDPTSGEVKCSSGGGQEPPYHYIFMTAANPPSLIRVDHNGGNTVKLFTFDDIPAGLKLAAKACMSPSEGEPPGPEPGPEGEEDKKNDGGPPTTPATTGIRLRLRRDLPLPKCSVIL